MKQKHSNIVRYLLTHIGAFLLAFLVSGSLAYSNSSGTLTAKAADFPIILLSTYQSTMQIGDTHQLIAVVSDGKRPTFKSSKSSVASVNTYGLITAKSAGIATITVKVSGAETSCRVTVEPTTITLNQTSVSLERKGTFQIKAVTSTSHAATFKTNKKSVATVSETGLVTAVKPGDADITVTCDKTKVTFKVKVNKPTIQLEKNSFCLYRNQTAKLSYKVSSGIRPTFRTNKKSVATVDEYGRITAVKHGEAVISVTLDGVTKTCKVTVKSPTIRLNASTLTLTNGQSYQLKATVSSKNRPVFHSSNSNVASIDESGTITTHKKGSAVISVSEDGTTAKCKVSVKE
ncbi:MAG: Ig domain-containing protein [Lachnospiraceae bacterium]